MNKLRKEKNGHPFKVMKFYFTNVSKINFGG